MVIAALAMTALLLLAALAIDVGVLWSARTQSQNADDAAALAAAATMIQQSGTDPATVDLAGARAEGAIYAGANATVGEGVTQDMGGNRIGGVSVVPADFKFGVWNLATRTLDPPYDSTNPNEVTGVRVTVRMDGVANKPSPSFLGRLLGRTFSGEPSAVGQVSQGYGFNVKNIATAYLGFEGEFAPGEFELPVALNSCDLSTGGCGADYCATISSPPNPCPLKWAQGADPVTCLDFSSTGVQNACWTVYDGDQSAINNPKLQEILDNGSPDWVQAGDEAYLDNGDKDETLKDIRNMFYGCDDNGTQCGLGLHPTKGDDLYETDPVGSPETAPAIDSWVVKLPVFECQEGVHCSGGDPFKIMGGVCFEIREILAPAGDYNDSTRVIKGKFLCPDSTDANERELFHKYCEDPTEPPQDPGGCNFGFRADKVVLVE